MPSLLVEIEFGTVRAYGEQIEGHLIDISTFTFHPMPRVTTHSSTIYPSHDWGEELNFTRKGPWVLPDDYTFTVRLYSSKNGVGQYE